MKKILLLFLLAIQHLGFAQQTHFPRDTSYTVHSTYQKLKKDHLYIEPVEAALPQGVRQEEVVYRKLGQRELHMDIFHPEGGDTKAYPGVLLIHGGGWRTGDKSLLAPLAQQIAARGYVTAVAEYRLSLEAPYPAAVHDLKAALRWMRAHAVELELDTTRMAALGTSAGGQLAALIGTTNGMEKLEGEGANQDHSSRVHAIVDIDGVLAFKHPESEEGSMAAQWLGGTYEEAPENWTEASALTHVSENTPPILFISSAFPRFHAGKKDMIKVLEEHDTYYESHQIPNAPHSFWLMHPWFESTVDYTVNFLDKVMKKRPVTLFLIGDSTVADKPYEEGNPEKGWGQVFPLYFKEGIKVENHAVNGRSTKSFIEEGKWDVVVERLHEGDYVFIEFGHNDAKSQDPTRYAPAKTAYRRNLERFIADIRARGGIPVLGTPIVRRRFDENGKFYDTHGDYPQVVREVADKHQVALIDLHKRTKELLRKFGEERSKLLFLHIEPYEYKSLPEGEKDDTHLSAYGAFKVSDLVVTEMEHALPALLLYLKE